MNKDENMVRVKLERHLWPDEIEERERKKIKRIKIVVSILSLLTVFVLGILIGIGNQRMVNNTITTFVNDNTNSKLSSILNIMSNEWYFASEYDDINQHLMDKAYYGMTNNPEVDNHTTYMSSEEVESFTQSINMNFVGIGVQFFNSGEYALVKKVFKDSPADKAGVLPGDIFNVVDGINVRGLSSEELTKLVKGEAGTDVVIEFLRQNEPIVLTITRAEVSATVYGQMIDDKTGYLEIYQFGDSTDDEVGSYLEMMTNQGLRKLIIDLRDNGGGYLDTLVHVLNYFLPENSVVMQQVYSDNNIEYSKTSGGQYTNIEEMVILINENTASASEVMTLALMEQSDIVTVVGVKSYGKGTVQVTKSFSDGSALKYTTSKWLSPSGLWINNVGIEPEVEVKLPEVIRTTFAAMEGDEVYSLDMVNEKIKAVQLGLEFLGYSIDRTDGYFDNSTYNALRLFQSEKGLDNSGTINKQTYETIYSSISKEWSLNKGLDPQYQKALELLND